MQGILRQTREGGQPHLLLGSVRLASNKQPVGNQVAGALTGERIVVGPVDMQAILVVGNNTPRRSPAIVMLELYSVSEFDYEAHHLSKMPELLEAWN